ncbi:PorT family protein [Pseudoflavitalea sp. X16]|uniref:outer membrane beta-barrel protein n=1 Tax=Paraflavitalea devenefica TaxID=2716334 RepID=UPI0014200C12|nr:outer membrane beta-barrel protein [Paraflavitalea devenefica]NII27576.1 PorT family protein [Paraflavitalea devenefica]
MRMIRMALCWLLLLLCHRTTHAQEYAFGFKTGANYSKISNLSTIILSEPYFINYSITETGRYGWHLGIYYDYNLVDKRLGFQTEILYARQGGNVEFSNYERDFHYKMEFAYQYVNLVGLAKWFPFEKTVALGAGPFLGINVATRNLKYTSWGEGKEEAFGTDLQQQQQLRNVLRGKNNFGVAVDASWMIKDAVKINGRFYWSATSAVETQANSYNFIATKNNNSVWELSVGFNMSSFFESN